MAREIRTAILTAGGLGTRMLPLSLAIPKEMLPIIVERDSNLFPVPALHYIFDSLYETGFRRFYVVVGRGKNVIEEYFFPNKSIVGAARKLCQKHLINFLSDIYRKIGKSQIVTIYQPYPKGFGDAVLRTKEFMVDDVFLLHAGDDVTYPNHIKNINALISHHMENKPKVSFLYEESRSPEKYGVVTGEDKGNYIEVEDVLEKPSSPPSKNVVVAVYVFDRDIYNALETTKPKKGEHQLTDAIRYLLKRGEKVHAVKISGYRLDLGSPDTYLESLRVLVKTNIR
ncbi:UTP--glucose-1-phosphate uridylyltransferase [Candidatus Bathyarchaeota archaeon]|nr:UTP--glucose-1-phosphate uridylyltransferase [Candidatus Bathyarchaeota archaeon]